jgi:hypothetical protein
MHVCAEVLDDLSNSNNCHYDCYHVIHCALFIIKAIIAPGQTSQESRVSTLPWH